MRLNRNSRLNMGKLVEIEGTTFWTRPDLPDIPVSPNDEWYTVKKNERIDSIAKKKMGDQGFWYVLAHENNLFRLPSDLKTGMRIRIPSASSIRTALGL